MQLISASKQPYTAAPIMKLGACDWCFFSSLVVLFVWPLLDNSCPYVTLLPDSASDVLADLHTSEVPDQKRKVPSSIGRPDAVITVYGYKTEHKVKEFIRSHPYEVVLFKSYLDADGVSESLRKLRGITAGRKFKQDNLAICGIQFGGLFDHGAICRQKNDYMMTLDPIWKGLRKNYYVHGNLVGNQSQKLHDLINFKEAEVFDSTYFGWLTNDTVTTPLHALWMVETMSFQMSGNKKWLFINPLDLKDVLSSQGSSIPYAGVSGEVFFPNLHLDNKLISHLKLAVTEPGDLLYFPPWSAHTVVTSSHLNVMTSLRYPSREKAFKVFPWKTAQGVMTNSIFGTQFHWTKESHYRIRMRETGHGRGNDEVLEEMIKKMEL